jgi:putative NADPH-quinone reductase
MRVLVVRAHPLEQSYNAALHERVLAGLGRAGHAIDDLDLYADGFDPRLSAADRARYHDVAAPLPVDVAPYVERLRRAEALVFVFPVWCFGVPAILKGFFDRVLRPGVAFELEGARVTPKLHNVRRLAAVTTYGRPRWMVWYVGDLPRRQITRYVRWFCAPGAGVAYLAHYHMNASTPASRAAFLERVERRMAAF